MLPNAPTPEKLDPRVKRTRSLIRQAFSELLAEKGFGALSVQDIAERAEINRATFYAHYPDKFALLKETLRQAFRAELEKRTLSACHYSEDNLRALIVTVCEFIARSNEHCKASEQQFDSLIENQVRRQIQELIELWLSQRGAAQPQTAATAAAWAIYGLAEGWVRQKNRPPVEAFAEQVLPLVAGNLK
ncbi:MAG: TetR/AcrR family transcriptional regulator [Chloroflexi bacterium]|nr:TetR/AcrR family transcriptional regulator [Chloroflexota bacterium]MCA2001195.1 TetR/AcrR family transcriptional regulator [Chloroflexota bacterium]